MSRSRTKPSSSKSTIPTWPRGIASTCLRQGPRRSKSGAMPPFGTLAKQGSRFCLNISTEPATASKASRQAPGAESCGCEPAVPYFQPNEGSAAVSSNTQCLSLQQLDTESRAEQNQFSIEGIVMTRSRLESRIQDAPAGAFAPLDPVKHVSLARGPASSRLSQANIAPSSQIQVPLDEKAGPFRFGIPELDSLTGGIPRGAITEILGPAGSGRAALMLSALANSTANRELCALVDADMLDVASAAAAGVDLDRLLWVRCREVVNAGFKATEWLLRSGGFAVLARVLTALAGKPAKKT